ncbi:hypothetical protein ASC94_10935 [Massilia sp. Root418]|nr:hypothetical protein ASC94_10935 [Massilia sp. Root418]
MTIKHTAISEADFNKQLLSFLSVFEGIIYRPYTDTKSVVTIGKGFNIEIPEIASLVYRHMGITDSTMFVCSMN